MAITSGFFNASYEDRTYNAEDFGFAMSMAIADGVDDDYLDKLEVTAGDSLYVSVGAGRAFFNGYWMKNESAYSLALSSSTSNDRIDAVVVDVKGYDSEREVTLDIVEGTASSSPVNPTLILDDDAKHWQYALAYVRINEDATSVTSVTDNRGTDSCPYIFKTGGVDTALSTTSNQPVQNKVVTSTLNTKLNISSVDGSLSTTSTNPVQNKVVATKLQEIGGHNIYGNNSETLAQAISSWADTFKKTIYQFNVFGQVNCADGVFFFQVDILYPDGTVEGCIVKKMHTSITYQCYRIPTQNAVLTELADTSDLEDTYKVMGYNGAKNLLKVSNTAQLTFAGVTVIYNGDGTYTANGTASGGNCEYACVPRGTPQYQSFYLKKGTYTYTVDAPITVYIGTTYNSAYKAVSSISSNGTVTFTIDDNTQSDYKLSDGSVLCAVYFNIQSGTTVNNKIIKPMIRLAEDTDTTYQPYAMTNKVITDKINEDKVRLDLVATSHDYTNESETLVQAINGWVSTYKPSATVGYNYYNLVGLITCLDGLYSIRASMINTASSSYGFLIKRDGATYNYWKAGTSNAAVTELAPKSAIKDSAKVTSAGQTLSASTANAFSLNYPSGYTYDNCMIISSCTVYSGARTYRGNNINQKVFITEAYATSSGITVNVVNANTSQATFDIEVFLQKIS